MKFPLDECDAKFVRTYDKKYSTNLYSYLMSIKGTFQEHSTIMGRLLKKLSSEDDNVSFHDEETIENYNAILERMVNEFMNILNEFGRDGELKEIYRKLSLNIERRYVFRDVLLLNFVVLGECVEYHEYRKCVGDCVSVLTGIMSS